MLHLSQAQHCDRTRTERYLHISHSLRSCWRNHEVLQILFSRCSFLSLKAALMFRYHPHRHGSVSVQVGGGAAGLVIVEDAEAHALPAFVLNMTEYLVVLQHIDSQRMTRSILEIPFFSLHSTRDLGSLSASSRTFGAERRGFLQRFIPQPKFHLPIAAHCQRRRLPHTCSTISDWPGPNYGFASRCCHLVQLGQYGRRLFESRGTLAAET
jgi:hypothetical protein